MDCRGAMASIWIPTRVIQVRFPYDCLLLHGDKRDRHSANHNLLPARATFVCNNVFDSKLFKMSGRNLSCVTYIVCDTRL